MATTPKEEETFQIKGKDLIKKVKELINESNVREFVIKDKNDKTIVVLPLTVGVIGSLLVPPIAVVGTIAALITDCTIVVKRKK